MGQIDRLLLLHVVPWLQKADLGTTYQDGANPLRSAQIGMTNVIAPQSETHIIR